MATPTLIYCGGGNKRFCEIAVAAGYKYGARLPETTYAEVYFADQEYRNPNRQAYMKALAKHRPEMATVMDWEAAPQFTEVMDWAEEASQYVQDIVIIPKVMDISLLPRTINSKRVVIGYSIPTTYGGTSLPLWELQGWPVHLLGGSPHRQMREFQAMRAFCDVVSADGNMMQKMANSRCLYWSAHKGPNGHWIELKRAVENDAPYECFRRSCESIRRAWLNMN